MDTAHLSTGGDIFKQSGIALSNFANFGLFGANAFDQNVKAGTENLLMDLSEQEDRTYQNYGNKRATGKDWINYKNSLRNGGGSYKSTFSPGETGERMRRMEGDEAGEIGSYKYNELLKDEDGDVRLGLDHIDTAITKQGENIQMILQEFFPEEARQNLPWEFTMIMSDIAGFGLPLSSLSNKVMFEFNRRNKRKAEADKLPLQDFKEQFVLTPDQLRDTREKMSANIGKLNLMLNQYLKNDKRLHQPILNMISLMNYGISYVDDIYRKSLRGGPEREKVTNIREEMTHNDIHVKANGRGAFFTPTHYESYIRISTDPIIT
ncbi:MAG: hypothetical protein IJI41_10175 [Anaerolineaceae bacterium]|nr:hypothetical protein [Anaerolineaceae bacterium]